MINLKKDNQDDEPQDEVIDTDYQLESYISKSVNYQYILSLIQNYLPNEGELLSKASQSETDDIDKYIDELGRTNKPLSKLVSKLWEKVKAHPENFAGQQMDQLLNEMIEDGRKEGLKLGREQGMKLGEERGLKLGEERGMKLGEERGLKLGEERGFANGQKSEQKRLARRLMKNMNLTEQQAADILGISLDSAE